MALTSAQRFEYDDTLSTLMYEVQDYNELVPKYPLPTYNRQYTTGLVIGSTKKFWDHFVADFKKTKELSNPVDKFCSRKIQELCAANLTDVVYEVRHDYHAPSTGKYIHIQTAGHVAGVAYYDKETMWSVHPEYGTWFVYRGVVIIGCDFGGDIPKRPGPVLAEDEKQLIVAFTKKAGEEGWKNAQTLLDIRRACKTGQSWQYEGTLLDYFYPIHRTKQEVLEAILRENC